MAEYFSSHWLAFGFLAAALLAGGLAVALRSHRRILLAWAAVIFVCGLGGVHIVPEDWSFWLVALALAVLFVKLLVVFLTGNWWAPLGIAAGVLLLLGLGAALVVPVSLALNDFGRFVASIDLLQPAWLGLLVLIPLIVFFSFRSLAGLGRVRRWIAIGLRCLLVLLLTLALAEPHARRPNPNMTVLFLWDRSLSIPQELVGDRDVREERIKQFISDAVAQRGPGRDGDKTGVIVFGREPRLELPPDSVPQLTLHKILSRLDDTHTNIAAALKLALASFPEGTGKRIVLISDGNENLGSAEEQARIAQHNGVQIDVVPIAAGRRNQNEVLVERVEAPPFTEQGARLPIRIVLRSFHPQIVVGNLKLLKRDLRTRKIGDQELPVFDSELVLQTPVKLRPGLNAFFFQQPVTKEQDAYTYEAEFVPQHIENDKGVVVEQNFTGDRIQNNRASANVIARGQRSVLLIEPSVGAHQLLANRLQAARLGMRVISVRPEDLPDDPDALALVLSKFDSVIIANVPAEVISPQQQKVIRSNTHDQGSGLIMIGGPNGFGAGGWQETEVEKALPVTCDLKSVKVDTKSGLVLMMHASEMMDGNAWQKKIAKLAVEKLSPADMVGMLFFDGQHKWHIPFQQIKTNRGGILRLVDQMFPGDMPDVDPAFEKAHGELTNPIYELGTKHIIFISDGDHWIASAAMLGKLRTAKITCTTVCITSHGPGEVANMKHVAAATSWQEGGKTFGGRSYHVTNPSELPAIYMKETRLVSQSFVHEKSFQPRLVPTFGGPTEGIQDVDPLHGFVRTTKRASPLVEMSIETPELSGFKFPVLAYWHYGLGKAVAFTSDARTVPGKEAYWDRDWANSNLYSKFWEQTVDWSLRATESGRHLALATERHEGKIRIIVHARDAKKLPITNAELKVGIMSPALKDGQGQPAVQFEQTSSGVYEAEIDAENVGAYFVNVRAEWDENGKKMTDSVRGGVTVPYSPEFAEMNSNPALLEKLRDITGGAAYAEEDDDLAQAAGNVFRPLPVAYHSLQPFWYWLVVLAGVGLFVDVGLRRITINPAEAASRGRCLWARLRGSNGGGACAEFIDRLKSRKAQVSQTLERERTTRKFAGSEGPVEVVDEASRPETKPPPRPKAAPPLQPPPQGEPQDYASRLLRAKKKAMEDRDKDKDKK